MKLLFVLLIFQILTHAQNIWAKETYRFAVVPEWRTFEQKETWQKITIELNENLPFAITFIPTSSLRQFEADLADGRFDIVYLDPYHYTLVDQQPGYRAFVAPRATASVGVLLARMNDPVESLEDLNHFRLALPPPKRFAASILPQLPLIERAMEYERNYYADHALAWNALLTGEADIATASLDTFEKAPAEIHVGMRIIWQSAPYSPYVVAAHPRIKYGDLIQLKRAFVKLTKDSDVQEILQRLSIPHGFHGARHSQWEDVRAIDYKSLNRSAAQPTAEDQRKQSD